MLKRLSLAVLTLSATASLAQEATTETPPLNIPMMAPLPPPRPIFVATSLSAYESLYQNLRRETIWIENGNLSSQVALLRKALQENPVRHGLSATYWTPQLEQMYQNFDPAQSEAFELAATRALVLYAIELSNGQVNPTDVGADVRLNRKAIPFDRVAEVLKNTTTSLDVGLETLAPQWPMYKELQNALVRLSQVTAENFPDVAPIKKNLKIGQTDPVLVAVKRRLATLGYPIAEFSPTLTKELQQVVNSYFVDQTIAGTPSLNVGSPFWAHIGTSLQSRIQQVRLTMEKVRWMPSQKDADYAYVNIALQRLRVYESSQLVIEMKTINGRSKRKTPTLKDQLTTVELNPNWTVPVTLVVEDKGPAIMQNPYYLEDNNMYVVDKNNREMSSWDIPWQNLTKNNAEWFFIKQRPGLGNALGIMKFHLTNPYAIYLHDTNERNLFSEHHRLLSSGCIRLERPLDLAAYLLRDNDKWSDRRTIEENLAVSRVIDPWIKAQNEIKLKRPLATYLMYLTVEAEAGKPIRFAPDYYGQDTALYNVIKASH